MADVEVMKQRNLESSILFMQQEHATTLKGLHGEIHKLQQRCSELTFQLAMEQTSTPAATGEQKEKIESLERILGVTNKKVSEQTEIIQKKDRRIQNLEQQVKALDRKYKDELKYKQLSIGKLEKELQERCTELASLRMTVLTARASHEKAHRHTALDHTHAKRYTPEPRLHSRESTFSSLESQEEDFESSPFSKHVPVPPLSSAGKVNAQRSSSTILTEVKKRPASGRKLLVDDLQDSNVHDDTEILKIVAQQKESLNLRQGKGMVVPPIHKENPKVLSPRSTNSASFAKRVRHKVKEKSDKSKSPDLEVETLAVDHAINTDLRKAREFNSFGTDA